MRGRSAFRFSLNQQKSFFFDRLDWEAILNPAEYHALWKIGWMLAKEGRKNIRRRRKPSKPGKPPTNWTGLMKTNKGTRINYGIDEPNMAVWIGPPKIKVGRTSKPLSQPTTPAILEFGGKVWNKFPTIDRLGNRLPGPRTRRVEPRPYMSKAYRDKEHKVEEILTDMIGKSPTAVMQAVNRGRKAKGLKPL